VRPRTVGPAVGPALNPAAGPAAGPGAGPAVGPAELIAVRHGESVLNAAAARASFGEVLERGGRDADAPLSPLGEAQSARLGRWLAGLPAHRRPEAVLCSPYVRARQTAEIVLAEFAGAGLPVPPMGTDERLRDREAGVLDLLHSLTASGDPAGELERRRRLGELYYRPPGGESLADVALRVRSLLADLRWAQAGRRVLVVAHDAVVLMLHYAIDALSEADLRRIMASDPVRNASVSRWVRADGRLTLTDYNRTDHLPAPE
jgi:probable phosphoglycerate mutase